MNPDNRKWIHDTANAAVWRNYGLDDLDFHGADDTQDGDILKWYNSRPVCNHESIVTLFLSQYQNIVCFSNELNRWLYFDGKVWQQDSGGAHTLRNMLMDFNKDVIEVISESRKYARDDDDRAVQDKYHKWAVGLNNNKTLDNVLAIAASRCAVKLNTFDTDDFLFNVSNGTVDLRTGDIRPHNPHDRITLLCDVAYNPSAVWGRWDSFLMEACERYEYVRYLQKEAGYALTGLTDEELLFLLYGDSETGKSTFYESVMEILKEGYGRYMGFSTLKSNDKEGGAPREDLLRLRSCRLAMCSEVNPKTKFDGALLKKLTSGETVVARGIRAKDSAQYEPKYKIFIGTNYAPIIPFDDNGSYRRFRVNPFKNVVAEDKKDKTLKRTFKNEREARERILAWLIEGAVRYFAEGLNDVPREVERGNSEYRREQNPLYLFIEDYCVIDTEADKDNNASLCSVERFVDEFNHVRTQYGADELSAKSFGRLMRPLQYKTWRDGKKRGYVGIRIKTQKEQDADMGFYEYQDDIDMQLEALKRYAFVTFDVYNAIFPYNACKKEEVRTGIWKNDGLNVKRHDVSESNGPADLVPLFISLLQKLKSAGPIAIVDKTQLLTAASERIKAEHEEWRDYDVLSFCTRLAQTDKEVQALMADLTETV